MKPVVVSVTGAGTAVDAGISYPQKSAIASTLVFESPNLILTGVPGFTTGWTEAASVLTTGTGTDQLGGALAATITEDSATSQHGITQDFTITAGTKYVFSVWAQLGASTDRNVGVEIVDHTGANGIFAVAKLSDGTLAASGVFGTGVKTAAGVNAGSNGWYQVWVSGVCAPTETTATCEVLLENNVTKSYAGNGTSAANVYYPILYAGSALPALPTGYIMPLLGRVSVTSTGNDSTKSFTITGTGRNSIAQSEVISGINNTTAISQLDYLSVSSITTSAGTAGAISAGTSATVSSPLVALDYYGGAWIGLQAVVTGTVGYQIESTDDNVLANYEPYSWYTFASSGLTTSEVTDLTVGGAPLVASAVRVTMTSGDGTVTLTVDQPEFIQD